MIKSYKFFRIAMGSINTLFKSSSKVSPDEIFFTINLKDKAVSKTTWILYKS